MARRPHGADRRPIDASDFMKNMLKALASGSRPDSIMWRR